MELGAWYIDGLCLPTNGEYKSFKQPQRVNGVDCRALMVHEDLGLRIRLESELGFRHCVCSCVTLGSRMASL